MIAAIDLGGDRQGDTASYGYLDGLVDAFFRRDATKHREIARRDGSRRQQLLRYPWWIVRTQLACGTGRRRAVEIEITGTEENVVKTG